MMTQANALEGLPQGLVRRLIALKGQVSPVVSQALMMTNEAGQSAGKGSPKKTVEAKSFSSASSILRRPDFQDVTRPSQNRRPR